MMIDARDLVLPFLAGTALGAVHFGGLWLQVRRLHRVAAPVRWLVAGAAVRFAVLAVGILLVMDGRWERLAAATAGLLVVRTAAVGAARRGLGGPGRPSARAARHEGRS
ncbi:MAG TPA: ATP synthase subunit I [Thermodesulfobacteriota bacterium]